VREISADRRWSRPVTVLPTFLFEPARPARAILLAWLSAFIPSILLSAVVSTMLPTLGQPQLALGTGTALVLVAVVAPVLETLIMAGVLAVLLRLMPPTAAVLASSLGWGVAHSLAAPAWGLVIWWPFLIFSILYVTWRQRSLLAAMAVPASAHGLQNFLPAALVYSGLGT
jgi:membrane protease YdiL (CAAX protease family)